VIKNTGSTKIVMGNVAFYKERIKELEAEVKELEKKLYASRDAYASWEPDRPVFDSYGQFTGNYTR
jgi:tetrahydromethanopterin S-methyltransferase subunit B